MQKQEMTYDKYKLQSKKLVHSNRVMQQNRYFGENTKSVWIVKNIKHFLRAMTFFDSSKEQVSIYDGWLERFVSFSYSGKKRKKGF